MNSMLQQSNNSKLVSELNALKNNPAQYLLGKNLDVPTDIVNNPQAIINWGVQIGRWIPQQVAQIKQMIGM